MRGVARVVVVVLVLAACGETGATDTTRDPEGAVDRGAVMFATTCEACHGPGGIGVSGMAGPLIDAPFVAQSTDDELVQFLIVGRPGNAPDNSTGIAMPARGGNPRLSDADLADIVAYLRTIQ